MKLILRVVVSPRTANYTVEQGSLQPHRSVATCDRISHAMQYAIQEIAESEEAAVCLVTNTNC